MLRVAVVAGSTRPGRRGGAVARWVHEVARERGDAEFELLDLLDHPLPLLDEPIPPSMGRYRHEHTRRWAEVVAGFDAFVFVTPEYNHSAPAALKNAIDHLYAEWNDKAAGFVGYGSSGGVRAVEHLRQVMAEVQVATVRQTVGLSIFTDWDDGGFRPADMHRPLVDTMLDQLVGWGGALKALREGAPAAAGA